MKADQSYKGGTPNVGGGPGKLINGTPPTSGGNPPPPPKNTNAKGQC